MQLKNIVLVVKNIEISKKFYQELFGMQIIRDFGENVMFSGGLVLQEQNCWEDLIDESIQVGNSTEIFFEDNDLDEFISKVEKFEPEVKIVKAPRTNSWGKRTVMLKDPDGHIIEVSCSS